MKKHLVLSLFLLIDLFGHTTAWSQADQSDFLTTGKNAFQPLTLGKDTQGAYAMSEVTAPGHFGAPLQTYKVWLVSVNSPGDSPHDGQSECPTGAISANRIGIRSL